MAENKNADLKNEYVSLNTVVQALVLYAQILASVENYEKANIAIKLAEPYRDRLNEVIKELSANKHSEGQDLA